MICRGISEAIIKEYEVLSMIERQKRVKITPDTKILVFQRAVEQPRIQRTALAEKLQVEIHGRKEPVPQLEVLERMISHYRNHAEDDPQEKPWGIAALKDNPIPPLALPFVLQEYKRHVDEGTVFTIRQAKWAAQLSAIGHPNLIDIIAKTEQMYGILGQQPDFEVFDKLLAGLPGQSANWQVPFAALCSEAGILKNDPTKVNKGGKV